MNIERSSQAVVLLVLLALVVQPLFAENRRGGPPGNRAPQGSISGTVVDGETSEPIASATVAVWRSADSTLVTGAVTQENGAFAIEGLRGGRYYVKVSFVGFATQTISDVVLGRESLAADLGTIRLMPDTQVLEEVEVSADREFMEVGIDRTVYNTRDQLVAAGGNASDVLQNIPSVEVDIDGNVSLRGSQNVAILINGKPSPMTGEALTSFLQGLPADAIERVEVIPNPSAKYEPDGMAGILNIVLKKNRDLGLSGGVNVSADTRNNYNASTNLAYQKGRVGVFASYSFRYGSRDSEGWSYRENRFRDPLTYLDQSSDDERLMNAHTLNTSLDYSLSDKNTLTASVLLSRRGGGTNGLTAYTELGDDKEPTARYNRTTDGDRSDLNMDYRLSFKRVVVPSKHELSVEARYEQEWENDSNSYIEEVFSLPAMNDGTIAEQQTSEQDERNRELSLQLDYSRPLGETGKMEAGYKGSLEQLSNDFYAETLDTLSNAWEPATHLNNTFDYDQQIHAAYGIVSGEVGPFGLQVGARLEQAMTTFDLKTTDEAYDNDYFSVFPSAYLTYKLSETRTAKLSYSKRINRPRTRMLNPFDDLEDPLNRRVGNPYLQPEYIHAFEASFTQFTKATSLTLTPYFRRTVDVIRWYQSVDENGVSTTTFKNLDTSDSWGAELIGTLRLGRRLNAYASLNAYRVVTDGSNVTSDLSNDAIGFSTRGNATVNVRPGLDLQLFYFYRAPMNIEGGRIQSFSMTNLALRQKLLNDRASLSLRVNDVFNTMGFHVQREDDLFYQEFDRSFNAQRIGLTFSYNFGQADRKRRNREGRPDDDSMDDVEMQMQ